MAKARQRHGLQLTPLERAPLIIALGLELAPTQDDAAPDVLPDTLPVRPVRLRRPVHLHPLALFLEGAHPVLPVVIPVLDLELLHERPVVVPVAPGELLEAAGPAPQDLGAGEVGGAGEDRILVGRGEGVAAADAAAAAGAGGGGGGGVEGGIVGVRLGEIRVFEGFWGLIVLRGGSHGERM